MVSNPAVRTGRYGECHPQFRADGGVVGVAAEDLGGLAHPRPERVPVDAQRPRRRLALAVGRHVRADRLDQVVGAERGQERGGEAARGVRVEEFEEALARKRRVAEGLTV